MDNNVFDQNISDEMNLTPMAESFLLTTAKWGKFMAIVGFVVVGLLVLGAIFMNVLIGMFTGELMNAIPSDAAIGEGALIGVMQTTYTILFIVVAVLYFFPTFYMYKFSVKAINAVNERNADDIELSFKNLKSYFKFMGILTIIMIAYYVLVFLVFAATSM